jgi:lipopolysaccharide/colanic/teichoic acid biosynthesis glycosyltransferase
MYLLIKRAFDMLVSATALLLLGPLFVIMAIIIRVDSPGPVFYRGKRAAKGNGVFRIFKFRSMVFDAEKKGGYSTAIDDPRFTKIGRFIRRFKIDELPQLMNVLIGDMSLVGPRPQVTFYTDQYSTDEKIILQMRPGITDLASIYFIDMDTVLGSGDVDKKYQTEIEPLKNKLRIKYVQEMSFLLDMRILLVTVLRVFGLSKIVSMNFDL